MRGIPIQSTTVLGKLLRWNQKYCSHLNCSLVRSAPINRVIRSIYTIKNRLLKRKLLKCVSYHQKLIGSLIIHQLLGNISNNRRKKNISLVKDTDKNNTMISVAPQSLRSVLFLSLIFNIAGNR